MLGGRRIRCNRWAGPVQARAIAPVLCFWRPGTAAIPALAGPSSCPGINAEGTARRSARLPLSACRVASALRLSARHHGVFAARPGRAFGGFPQSASSSQEVLMPPGGAPVPPEREDYVRPRPRAPCSLTFRSGPECAGGSSPPPSASRLLHHRDVSRRRPQPSKARWNMILDCGQCMEDLFLKERMLCCSHIAHVIGLRPSRGLTLAVCSKRLSWLRPSRVPCAGTKRPSKCPRMPVSFSMTARVAASV
jgi:hypothetical protein